MAKGQPCPWCGAPPYYTPPRIPQSVYWVAISMFLLIAILLAQLPDHSTTSTEVQPSSPW
jgi:hypothetical protein